jgi:hypothetical protein
MELPYLIMVGKTEVIVSFQNYIDRDDCMAFLQDRYPDVKFRAVNEDE